jgi:hypothetical protein
MRRLTSIVLVIGWATSIILIVLGLTLSYASVQIFAPVRGSPVRTLALSDHLDTCTIDWSRSQGSCTSRHQSEQSGPAKSSGAARPACAGLNRSYPDRQVAHCAQERNLYRSAFAGQRNQGDAVGSSPNTPGSAPTRLDDQSGERVSTTFYVEFIKKGSRYEPDGSQKAALRQALSSTNPKRIIYFVHGFRNSADARTGDPGRFATMMAFMTAFADQRCDGEGARRFGVRCDAPHETIGVYLAWPAAVVDEASPLGAQLALLTFPRMKQYSDAVGPELVRFIEDTTAFARQKAGMDHVRTLAVGHSLGGNALLTGLLDISNGRIGRQGPIGRAMEGWKVPRGTVADEAHHLALPGADLFVLMNPAAEAQKWVELQLYENELRQQAGRFHTPQSEQRSNRPRSQTQYSIGQPPRIISMQVPCGALGDPAEGEISTQSKSKTIDNPCDIATFSAFRMSQVLANQKNDQAKQDNSDLVPLSQITSLGHYMAKRPANSDRSIYIGLSHTITDNSNSSSETATSIDGMLRQQGLDQCEVLPPGWLREVRWRSANPENKEKGPQPWDTTNTAIVRSWTSAEGSKLHLEAVQSLYGVYMPRGYKDRLPVEGNGVEARTALRTALARLIADGDEERTLANNDQLIHQDLISDRYTPFWNTVLSSSLGDEHGGFYSRRLMCHIAQLWLDAPSQERQPIGAR